MLLGPFVSRFGTKKIGFMGISETAKEDLRFIKELLEAGKVVSIIDKCYPLRETADAIKYLIEEHGRGKVIISVESKGILMKAIVWTKYGSPDGLQLQEVAKPTPKDNEVLIKVHAATASTADTEFRRLKLPFLFAIPLRLYLGFIKPTRITILGTEFAGEIVSAGKEVTRYKPGDQVFGYTGLGMGTYAEYMCLPETPSALASVMGIKPANLTMRKPPPSRSVDSKPCMLFDRQISSADKRF